MKNRFAMAYPTEMESEDRLLDDLAAFLEQFDLDPALNHGLTLCISEAFTNALKHGNRWDQSKKVFVDIEVKGDVIIADITDAGSGALSAIGKRPRPDILAESGRGIDFIFRFCPNTELTTAPDGGLRVRLTMPRKKTNETVRNISRR